MREFFIYYLLKMDKINLDREKRNMESIIEYLKQKYQPRGIVVYGSFADGSNNQNSDFDALVITELGEKGHDNSIINGIEERHSCIANF